MTGVKKKLSKKIQSSTPIASTKSTVKSARSARQTPPPSNTATKARSKGVWNALRTTLRALKRSHILLSLTATGVRCTTLWKVVKQQSMHSLIYFRTQIQEWNGTCPTTSAIFTTSSTTFSLWNITSIMPISSRVQDRYVFFLATSPSQLTSQRTCLLSQR